MKLTRTDIRVPFKDIPPGGRFFWNDVYWTKSSWSICGVFGATALAGYMDKDGFATKTFNEVDSVFTVTISE